ncbi:BlaI/MecI/CopY family transcriptional regulator [Anaerococcus sp. NML200574]|uniref:BlaI/MecI/CopY family transcriptional regulator n=1 Tax=Anaerococcus sp. NML200574 TaxID=2954486 RepID=UPI002237A3A8|nr:BlaI/MecI/CopY family transcriptional regulator [Anaerococcus sp. NML200574]MCW6677648.1 BlaI/MecI/CopY family transcriptional regulator [Anaerococcus sp. NML200574]
MDFSDGELMVMELLWQGDVLDENGEIKAIDLAKVLKDRYKTSKTSAYTFFGRLIDKGAISRRYPNYTISVSVSREDALYDKQKEVFNKLFKGSLLNMCKTFLTNEKISKEELDEMRKLIDSFDEE